MINVGKDMENTVISIDNDWIEQEKDEQPFDIFYKDQVENINIVFIYIVNDNIIHIKKNKHHISNNCIPDSELYKLILDNKSLQHTTFYIDTIFKYNFTLEPSEVTHYSSGADSSDADSGDTWGNDYLKEHSSSYSIIFDQSIKLFENLNSLYFVMTTQKSNNKTRRIYINTENKKTRRKY